MGAGWRWGWGMGAGSGDPPPPLPRVPGIGQRRMERRSRMFLCLRLTSLVAEGPCAEPGAQSVKKSLAFDVNISCSGLMKLDVEGPRVPALLGQP